MTSLEQDDFIPNEVVIVMPWWLDCRDPVPIVSGTLKIEGLGEYQPTYLLQLNALINYGCFINADR